MSNDDVASCPSLPPFFVPYTWVRAQNMSFEKIEHLRKSPGHGVSDPKKGQQQQARSSNVILHTYVQLPLYVLYLDCSSNL